MVHSKPKKRRTGRKASLFKKRLAFLSGFVFLLLILFFGMRLLGPFQSFQNTEDWAVSLRDLPLDRGTNYLLYGIKGAEETAVEELFFLNYPPEDGTLNIIYIPGNLLMHRLGEDRASEAAAAQDDIGREAIARFYTPTDFYEEGGAELLLTQVSHFLDVPIHSFVEVDYRAIPVLAEHCDSISVAGEMAGADEYLEFLLQEVSQEQPEQQEQQESIQQETTAEHSLQEALHKAGALKYLAEESAHANEGIFATSGLLREVSPYLNTNLTWKELQELHETLEPLFDPEGLVVELPGEWQDFNGEYYMTPDQTQVASITENLGQDQVLPREMITVEVLNGCGISGIAGSVAEILSEEGFNVVNIDNAPRQDYQQSQVISRVRCIEVAREVAKIFPPGELFEDCEPDSKAMVTVIVGKDY